MEKRAYIGDGVYAAFDGYHIWVVTSDGYSVTNRIALEPGVFQSLVEYEQSLRAAMSRREEIPLSEGDEA